MKKTIKKVVGYLRGNRVNPSILNPNWITYLSLRKGIVDFANHYTKKGDKILDFGCGNMVYKKFFIEKGAKEYVGIDIGESPEFNKEYIVYGGGKLPIQDNEFDITVSTQVFEHVDDPLLYGTELERVTKKGGHLFITIAHVWEYHPYPKHYYNIFLDAIPLIFKNSQIVQVKGDTTSIGNSIQMLIGAIYRKCSIIGVGMAALFNSIVYIGDILRISRVKPVDYSKNSMTGNIIITLKVIK